MKFLLVFALLAASLASSASAQTRVQVGSFATGAWNNYQAGAYGSLEQSIGKHFEVDLMDGYSFSEIKPGYGRGTANVARISSIYWVNDRFGLQAIGEESGYTLNTLSKGAIYVSAGPIFKIHVLGFPARFTVGYIRELANGITAAGIETPHLNALLLLLSTRLGCSGAVCFRMTHEFTAGSVLTQGNPACDGTGPTNPVFLPCPRSRAAGGGFKVSFGIEFPRPRGQEDELF